MNPTDENNPDGPGWSSATARGIGVFLVVGVFLRVLRYALNFPLWSDEAFVAVNLIDRGYGALLRPLDHGQICPVLFLWAERAVVDLLGFREGTLRLFPLVCGVASVFLFRRAAGWVANGAGLLLAVGVFAVSVAPIRYASEVKPYASDLLAALLLLGPALGWLRSPERTGRLWALAALAPLAQAMSHPAIFVAGGIVVGLSATAWRERERGALPPFIVFGVVAVTSFAASYLLVMRPQDAAMPEGLREYWSEAFPPMGRPFAFLRWLAVTHTGKMLGYPGGGDGGGSTLTLLFVIAGAAALWSRGQRAALATLLAPFALTFIASALRRYPYGGETRHMQYVAPSLCLLMGVGAEALIQAIPRPRARFLVARATAALLAAGAIVLPIQYVRHPYINRYDVEVRDFSRRFWPELSRDAEVACLSRDYGVDDDLGWNLRAPFYLCNQRIHAPLGSRGGLRLDTVSTVHPLRCVLRAGLDPGLPSVAACLTALGSRFGPGEAKALTVDLGGPGGPVNRETYMIFEFRPRGEVAKGLAGSTLRR